MRSEVSIIFSKRILPRRRIMTKNNTWDQVTSSPIFQIHPNRDEPAKKLHEKEKLYKESIRRTVKRELIFCIIKWFVLAFLMHGASIPGTTWKTCFMTIGVAIVFFLIVSIFIEISRFYTGGTTIAKIILLLKRHSTPLVRFYPLTNQD